MSNKIDRNILYNLYINKSLSRKEISKLLDITENEVKYLLSKFNIKKDKNSLSETFTKFNITREELYKYYIEDNLSVCSMAEKYNVSKGTILKNLKKFNLYNLKTDEDNKQAIKNYYLKKYNVDHPTKSDIVKQKQKETNLNKYGTVSVLQNEEVKEKSKNTMLNKYGTLYFPSSEKYKETMFKKYGVTNVFQLEKTKTKIKQVLQDRYGVDNILKLSKNRNKCSKALSSNTCKEKRKRTLKNKYDVEYAGQILEGRIKAVITAKSTKSNIDGTKFDSSYERDFYDYCLRNDIKIEDRQIPIHYKYNGKQHITFIDFKVDGYLIECKGPHLLKGVYDYKLPVPIEKKLEVYKEHHVIIITDSICSNVFPKSESKESNGLKYLSKCPNPLIGIDIDLFRNPKVPYRDDRPKCFYDVKVDKKLSVNEAWEDELLRWKMIKNRIDYTGGFIDNKQILTAMNVTRTCKQPSWFSKSYAKELIQKYITTQIILDPFAGWGTRCDASKELNKNYYGWDLNKELVEWHHLKDRTFDNGCGIEYGNANNIKSDRFNCSVFICPPYTDYEIYFEDQDLKTTQCEWLSIVMKNIPNAREYLMVCKVVDKGFEKYIVEEKINKSHFGMNKEFVLLIKNEKE